MISCSSTENKRKGVSRATCFSQEISTDKGRVTRSSQKWKRKKESRAARGSRRKAQTYAVLYAFHKRKAKMQAVQHAAQEEEHRLTSCHTMLKKGSKRISCYTHRTKISAQMNVVLHAACSDQKNTKCKQWSISGWQLQYQRRGKRRRMLQENPQSEGEIDIYREGERLAK